LKGATPPHSNARARLTGAPHARAVSAMAGISSSSAAAAPLSQPPEPPAAEARGGDAAAAADDDTFSPILDLLQRFPDLFAQKVLAHLDPIDRTFLAQTGGACRAAVAASDLPRAGTRREVLGRTVWVVTHRLVRFCTSVERLAWAKNNGCPWDEATCSIAARDGHLEVLKWAREYDCPWDKWTCAWAAMSGHLEILRWVREHECLWDEWTCFYAAHNRHLEVLQWARQNGCPWSKRDCLAASRFANSTETETLAWVRTQPM